MFTVVGFAVSGEFDFLKGGFGSLEEAVAFAHAEFDRYDLDEIKVFDGDSQVFALAACYPV